MDIKIPAHLIVALYVCVYTFMHVCGRGMGEVLAHSVGGEGAASSAGTRPYFRTERQNEGDRV